MKLSIIVFSILTIMPLGFAFAQDEQKNNGDVKVKFPQLPIIKYLNIDDNLNSKFKNYDRTRNKTNFRNREILSFQKDVGKHRNDQNPSLQETMERVNKLRNVYESFKERDTSDKNFGFKLSIPLIKKK